MNRQDEIIYLGRVISLLAKHEELSLGEIKNKTRHFINKHRQTESSIFSLLEQFCNEGYLTRVVRQSRIRYSLSATAKPSIKDINIDKVTQVESGTQDVNVLMEQIRQNAIRYEKAKAKDSSGDSAGGDPFAKFKNYKPAPPPESKPLGEGEDIFK